MSAHERAAWAAYLTEFDLLRYPGGVFALLSFLVVLSLIATGGTTFGVVCVSLSLPVMLFSARYHLATVLLALVIVSLQTSYLVTMSGRVGTPELVGVLTNFVFTLMSLASSFLFPHQYGSFNRPEHWRASLDQLHCAIPVFHARSHGQGDSAPLDATV